MSVDSRIVTMKFDNAQFQQGAATTMSTLDKLKQSLSFSATGAAATKSLGFISGALEKFGIKNPFAKAEQGASELGRAAQQVAGPAGVGAIEGGVTGVSKTFLAMSTIAITALSRITNKAIDTGTRIASSLTIAPVKQGFAEYELKMDSIQTMLANTARYGTKLPEVMKNLNELNDYADKTIYNFGDMTKNIGLFTNAGLRIGEATSMIKGFSNSAAASGTSAQGAAGAAYQLSQALSAGTIRLMDWRSLTNVGMGNKNMQQGLVDLAESMGVLDKAGIGAKEVMSDFNGSLEKKWLSADVMSKYLKIMAGDMDAAKMKTIGLTDAQIKNFQKQQKTAEDAATKVRTFTKLMDTLQEAVGSTWAETSEIVLGDFNEATKLWTKVNDVVGGMLGEMGDARNKVLTQWDDLGGRKVLIEGLGTAFGALFDVLGTVKDAFRDIFPAKTGKDLFALTQNFALFAEKLKPSKDTLENLRSTFAGVFAIFSIAGKIIGAVVGQFKRLFGAIFSGSGSFLEFTASIGDAIVKFNEMLETTGVLKGFFQGIGDILAVPISLLGKLGGLLMGLFTGFDSGDAGKVTSAIDSIGDRLSPLEAAGQRIKELFSRLGDIFGTVGQAIGDALGKVGEAIGKAFSSENFDKTLDTLNTALLGGILLTLKNFFSGNSIGIEVGGSGFFDTVKDTLEGVTDTLATMQASIKADILLKIAGALAVMTASIVALALIDSKALTKALTAMVAGFTILGAALVGLNTAIGIIGAAKLPLITGSLVALGGAMLLMAAAIKVFQSMEFGDMVRGMVGFGGTLLILTKAVGPLSANAGGMIRAAAAILILGVAMNVMAGALKLMSMLSWDEMVKGFAGVAGSLVIFAGAMRLMPKGMIAQAVAITILAGAMGAMAGALTLMSTLSWDQMVKGLVGFAGSMVIIAGAMHLMPGGANMLMQASALVILGGALNLIGLAVASMGGMTWEEIAKGLITLAGSLGILAAGLYLMTGSLAGAAALVVTAGALAVLTPVLMTLGSMSWEAIAKGLTALAGAFLVLGVAGLVLAPLSPIILALGAAILMIGAGFALAGAGALALAAAFGIVAAAGAAGLAVIGGAVKALVQAIPGAFKALGEGIVKFAQVIAKNGPAFTKAMATILQSILRSVIQNIPLIGKAFMSLIDTALRVLVSAIPKMVTAGMKILLGVLTGIRNHISQIIQVATDIVVKFINGVANALPRVIQAGVNLILKFINGVANAIRNNSSQLGAAGGNLATAIVEGMAKGIWSGIGAIKDAAMGVAKSALDAAKNFLGIKSPSKEFEKIGRWSTKGFQKGLVGGLGDVKDAMKEMTDTLKSEMQKQKDAVKDEQKELDDLLDAKKRDEKAIAAARKRLAASEAMYASAKAAHESFTKDLKDERNELKELAKEYDAVAVSIEDAQKALDDAIKTRDDAEKSISDSYTRRPDIDEETTVEDYIWLLNNEAEKNKKFLDSMNQLVKLGMDDATYQKLLDEGVGIQPFLDELIAAGPEAVEAIDENTLVLENSAKELGKRASVELHQAGVDAAQGLLDGLRSKKAEIEAEMKAIAKMIARTVRKQLKIKSPSRVFMEIGRYTNEGLAEGLVKYSGSVEKSATGVANTALNAIKATMAGASDLISDEMNMNPTIAPVLDLTQLKKDASGIGSTLSSKSLAANVSYGQAASVSTSRDAAQSDGTATAEGTTQLVFQQYNNSPKALSHVEIYRGTKNQLSLAKEALTKS